MKIVCIGKDGSLTRFLFDSEEKYDNPIIKDTKIISANAFQNAKDIEKLYFDENLVKIGQEAFSNAENLEVFCCGEVKKEEGGNTGGKTKKNGGNGCEIVNLTVNKLKNPNNQNFTVETKAFAYCKNLTTVVFPICSKLIIEKDAFTGCSSLRTVVILSTEIDFTENPFAGAAGDIVFVCKDDSPAHRFARENGYRSVHV